MAEEVFGEIPVPRLSEEVPGHVNGISALASAHAPFLYFDGAPNFGHSNGVLNITLEALRFQSTEGVVYSDRVTVAHLRMSLQAAIALKQALDNAILMATPVQPGPSN